MAATKTAHELEALRRRVAELEKQLQDLQVRVNAAPQSPQYWPDRPHTEEEARAFHESSLRVQEIINKNREADRRRAAAEYDRLHGRAKKAPSAKRNGHKQSVKTRKAG